MKYVCTSSLCTGCGACEKICPVGAISLKPSLDKYEMIIDEDKCIHCGKCDSVCQNKNQVNKSTPVFVKQGWSADSIIRQHSSSGGIATTVAIWFLENLGSVFCCSYTAEGKYEIRECKTKDDVLYSTGSKYVKSEISNQYKTIEDLLKNDRRVLIIALPCQIAAIKKYVGEKLQNNLYTVDLICHGAPKIDLLNKYIDELEIDRDKRRQLQFRKKAVFSFVCNGEFLKPEGVKDRYTAAFLSGLSYTDNCYSCQYASFDRISDITLGDSWGSNMAADQIEKGISLILCQTKKGEELLRQSDIITFDVDCAIARANNKQLNSASVAPKERERFFRLLEKNCSFSKAMFLVYPIPSIKAKIKEFLK